MKNKQGKYFDREAFENDIMTVIKSHFTVDHVEDLTGTYSLYPEWICGVWGGYLDCSVSLSWKVAISEDVAKKYGKWHVGVYAQEYADPEIFEDEDEFEYDD